MERELQSDYLKYLSILRRHWIPAGLTFATVLGLAIIYLLLKTPVYRIQGKIIYKQDNKSSALLGLTSAVKDILPTGSDADRDLQTEINIILSEPILQKTINWVKVRNPQWEAPKDLEVFRKNLTVKNIVNTNIISISYDDTDQKLAASIVGQLMQNYLLNDLKTTRAASIAARQFIISQLPGVRKTVFQADLALRAFKERNKVSDLKVMTKSNAEDLTRIASTIDQAQAQWVSLNSDYTRLKQKLNLSAQDALAISEVSQSQGVQASLADVQGLERQLAQARALYGDAHPSVIDLNAKYNQAKSLLQAKVRESIQGQPSLRPETIDQLQVGPTQQDLLNQLIKTEIGRASLGKQLTTLQQQQSAYQRQFSLLPGLMLRERELSRELEAAESTYQALLKSLQQVQVTENQTVGNVRIIEPPQIPLKPIAPKKLLVIAAGTLAGLLLAIAVLYLLETLDSRIKRVEEAQEIYGYTLLGTIPQFPPLNSTQELAQVPVLQAPKSSLSESYRVLQANIKFLESDKPIKVITVSSAVAGEGKSTTCANLAAALSQMGHHVLLVDADLRRPSQHHFWEVTNTLGMSDYLAGQIPTTTEAMHIVHPDLEVLTSGTLPPNPLGLLDSVHMSQTLQDWSKIYDFVIIDAPPIAVAADAAILGRLSDGLLMVARPKILDKNAARITKGYLEQAGVKVLGLVVNGMIPENESNSYYYYSHYNYYAQDPTPKK